MKAFPALVLAAAAWLAGLPSARAETHRVDDSASQVLASNVRMKWDSVAPQRGAPPTVSGAVGVLVRLDTAPWVGRQGRVYLMLPAQASGEITATWTTHGRLLPGMLRSGERTLVYAGLLPGGLLEDTLQLTVRADGGQLTRAEQLNFGFEVDVESP
ncbi:MAG: hypothetical protein ACYC42_08290 [Lysobacter sp.]